jgi:hypothetical protein
MIFILIYFAYMIEIQGYTKVNYLKFQTEMDARFANCELSELEIAVKLGLKSTATIKNAFRKDNQIVSDEVMSGIMECI